MSENNQETENNQKTGETTLAIEIKAHVDLKTGMSNIYCGVNKEELPKLHEIWSNSPSSEEAEEQSKAYFTDKLGFTPNDFAISKAANIAYFLVAFQRVMELDSALDEAEAEEATKQ